MSSPIGARTMSKAGREVSIRSDLIANSNTPDKRSSARSAWLQEETCIERLAYVQGWEGGVPGEGGRARRASEGDSLVVQHGSVWSMRILDMFPPVRVRVCVPGPPRPKRASSWASAPYYARRGPLERAGRFGSDPPFPALKDRIYCDNSFRSIADRPALKRGAAAPLSTAGVIHLAATSTPQVKRMWGQSNAGNRMVEASLNTVTRYPL